MAKTDPAEPLMDVNKIKKWHDSIVAAKNDSDEAREQVSEVSKAAKEAGVDTKVMKLCIRLEKMDPAQCKAFLRTFETYVAALGLDAQQDMFDGAKDKEAA